MRYTHSIVAFAVFAAIGAGAASAEPLMGPEITTAANPGDQFTPAVAWDHEHKRWLVVWEQDVSGDRQIVGRLIANNGNPLTASFFIADTGRDETDPDVVYDPGHDRYLVVWVDQVSATDSDIAGRWVDMSLFVDDFGSGGTSRWSATMP